MRALILFDVDGTLIKRGDPDHLAALDHGVHQAFPEAGSVTVHNLDYDGKVERLIASEILAQAGIDLAPDDPALDRVFDLATDDYRSRWAGRENGVGDLLPGVSELIEELSGRDGEFALGVLTGGIRGIVAVKLDRLGLTEAFPVGAFGNEVPDRPSLVPLAMRRAGEYYQEEFDADRTVIVGDTPHDVHCAHVHGIPCLGVATGKYTDDDLLRAGADDVLPDLSVTSRVIGRLLTLTSVNG